MSKHWDEYTKCVEEIKIPDKYYFGNTFVKPLRGGETIKWCIDGINYNN